MITETEFKGLHAIKLENGNIRVIVIPELGGKVASLIEKKNNFEFLFQHKKDQFLKPELYSDFAEFDASGFDDCFPSVDFCSVDLKDRKINYPDHGEIWSSQMKVEAVNDMLNLSCSSKILPYRYEKKITLRNNILTIDYCIVNTGDETFPCIWTMHGLLNCEEDMEIILPDGTDSILMVQNSKILGVSGTVHSYPEARTCDGDIYRLNKIQSCSAGKTEKFYIHGDLREGKCGVYYPSVNLSYNIFFDKKILPYLGVWITEGGFRGDYNIALEPSNGFYDSIDIAGKNKKLKYLHADEELSFRINIEIIEGR